MATATLGEILKRLPGVTLGGPPGRGGRSALRGLGGGYTQILLDGDRVPPGFSLDSIDARSRSSASRSCARRRPRPARARSPARSTSSRAKTSASAQRRALGAARERPAQRRRQLDAQRPARRLDVNFSLSAFAGDSRRAAPSRPPPTADLGDRRGDARWPTTSSTRTCRRGLHLPARAHAVARRRRRIG